MDAFSVETSVILGLDFERVLGKGYGITNEYIAGIVKKYPGRFIGFASVDPMKGDRAAYDLERAVSELHLKGLKLHPCAQQFYPNDKRCYPVYEMAEKLGIPLICHTGVVPGSCTTDRIIRYKYSNPMYIDDVVRDFPGLRIVLPHLGGGYFFEAFALAGASSNIYFDTVDADIIGCCFQPYDISFTQLFRKALNIVGSERILFGSEGGYDVLKRNLQLLYRAFNELGTSEEDRTRILGGNARQLVKPTSGLGKVLKGGLHETYVRDGN